MIYGRSGILNRAVWVCSLWSPVAEFKVWLSYSYLGMINTLLPQWLRRSKDFSFDTSSSDYTILVELRSQQKEGRMTSINWNKPSTPRVGGRSFCFYNVKARKGGYPSQSQASFPSLVFTFICHKGYLSALWNMQYLLQIFGVHNFCKLYKHKMAQNIDWGGKGGNTAVLWHFVLSVFCGGVFWGVHIKTSKQTTVLSQTAV